MGFFKMAAKLDANGDPIKMTYGINGHGADKANGGIDKDWDFHADIPDKLAGRYAEKDVDFYRTL